MYYVVVCTNNLTIKSIGIYEVLILGKISIETNHESLLFVISNKFQSNNLYKQNRQHKKPSHLDA